MKRWISMTGFILGLSMSSCTQVYASSPHLKLESALVRVNEAVPVILRFSNPFGWRVQGLGVTLHYPEGVQPGQGEVKFKYFPAESAGKGPLTKVADYPEKRLFALAAVVPAHSYQPPVSIIEVEVPFKTEGVTPPRTLTLTAEGAITDENGVHELDPVTGAILVTPASGRGDVDGDGQVTGADAQWALRLLLGSATGSPGVLQSADAWPEGGDGTLTLQDTLTILRMAVGLNPC